jgi:hypothetical protein
MIAETIPGLGALSPDQKIILAAELWRDAAGRAGDDPSPALVKALNERLGFDRQHPEQVSTWEEVRSRIVRRKGK